MTTCNVRGVACIDKTPHLYSAVPISLTERFSVFLLVVLVLWPKTLFWFAASHEHQFSATAGMCLSNKKQLFAPYLPCTKWQTDLTTNY